LVIATGNQMKPVDMPVGRIDLVIARYDEDLAWVRGVPDHVRVLVYNKGAEIDDVDLLRRIDVLVRRENVGRETESYLAHVMSGESRDADWVVFAQGDPFPHSPDFLGLLENTGRWSDVQGLAVRWLERCGVPPRVIVDGDRRDWLDGLRVRHEVFSLSTWGAVAFHDSGAVGVSGSYLRHHGLPSGTNVAEHFLRLAGWDDLADEAGAADLGLFSYGAIFAVRGVRLGRIPPGGLERLLGLSVSDPVHGYICERLWLHFFGKAFVTIDRGLGGAGRTGDEIDPRMVPLHVRIGFRPGARYDLNLAILTHAGEENLRRIACMKRWGVLNPGEYKVHLTLIVNPGDFEKFEWMAAGWSVTEDVSIIEMPRGEPIPKINGYYLWLMNSSFSARWHGRVDDDSMTDVAAMMDYLDRDFGDSPVHVAGGPMTLHEHEPLFVPLLLEHGIFLPEGGTEYESSFTSDAGMCEVFSHRRGRWLIEESGRRFLTPGDRALAFAAHVAGVRVVQNAHSLYWYDPAGFSLFGGDVYHIHYVPWHDDGLVDRLEMRFPKLYNR
jgi:hypothetical protein